MNTETHVHYQIAVADADGNSSIRGDGWSGYYKRLSLRDNGQLPVGEEVYGLPQAREHVAELRATKGEYKDYWSTVPLAIQRVTTTTEDVETSEGIGAL